MEEEGREKKFHWLSFEDMVRMIEGTCGEFKRALKFPRAETIGRRRGRRRGKREGRIRVRQRRRDDRVKFQFCLEAILFTEMSCDLMTF